MKARQGCQFGLIAALLLQLVGCGGMERGTDTTTALDTESSAPEVTEAAEWVKPDVDFGGRTVNFTGYSYSGSWAILRYNVGIEEENGDVINDAIVERNRAVEDALNVNLEMLPLAKEDRNSAEVLKTYILAQEDVVTFGMQMNCGLSSLLTTEGMLVDLRDIKTLDLTHSWWNQQANEEYTIYGKQLAAVGDLSFFNLGAPIVTYFSKTLVDDMQLDDPYQLVYDGKWTLDALARLSAEAAKDVNGNTTVDDEDIFGFAGENDTLYYSLFSSGVRYSTRDDAGNISIAVNNERTLTIVEKMVTLLRNRETTLHAGEWESKHPSVFESFFMPKLMNNELLFFSNQLHVALSLRQMDSDFGILPMPKYDEEQEDYISIANTWFSDHIVVPATNTDLEMTGYLLDAMGYFAQQYITPAFIDESIMNKGVRDEDSLKMVRMVLDNQTFDVGLLFNWGKMSDAISGLTSANNTNFASMWAGIENSVNESLKATAEMLGGK